MLAGRLAVMMAACAGRSRAVADTDLPGAPILDIQG